MHVLLYSYLLVGVQRADWTLETGLYCMGWIKRGPVGVLVNTTSDAFETADAILSDLRAGRLAPASGSDVTTLLRERSMLPLTQSFNKTMFRPFCPQILYTCRYMY